MFHIKYRYFFIIILSLYSFVNILFTEGQKLFGENISWYALLLLITTIVFTIWEGNRYLANLFTPPVRKKIHPLLYHFFISLLLVMAVSGIITVFAPLIITNLAQGTLISFKLSLGFAFRINLFLHSINAIVFFFNKLKTTELEAETLKKKTLEARFEALRNQINPHFLFNSLNVLSTLVYKDADSSAKFIDQLSKVYRYLLYYQEKKIVTLEEEIKFIESYFYLLKIRFGENLIVNLQFDEEEKEKFLPPASLQLLVENAIKHNIISTKKPLKIDIYTKNSSLIIKNNLQEKSIKEPSTFVGLSNIQKRYEFISNERVEVKSGDGKFSVRIPLIQLADI